MKNLWRHLMSVMFLSKCFLAFISFIWSLCIVIIFCQHITFIPLIGTGRAFVNHSYVSLILLYFSNVSVLRDLHEGLFNLQFCPRHVLWMKNTFCSKDKFDILHPNVVILNMFLKIREDKVYKNTSSVSLQKLLGNKILITEQSNELFSVINWCQYIKESVINLYTKLSFDQFSEVNQVPFTLYQ